jgi:phosphoribosylformimino-5-aminoimidazole carboxamide ribotide isomerase
MIIYPAIDILDGKVVRLQQGRLDAVKVYNDSPLEQARLWEELGAEWIHVVDLDGAVLGEPKNLARVSEITHAVDVPVQCGGGVRTRATLDALMDVGVQRVVLGTTIITEPEFVSEACAEYGDRIVAGVDARDGKVAIEGWKKGTEFSIFEIIQELTVLGLKRLAYTDIALDGMRTGINYGAYRVIAEKFDIPVIASGGVASLQDISDLAAVGGNLEGVIVGSALYEKLFTLPEAIEAGKDA